VLSDHRGPAAVIGFNPYSHAWFADRYPGVLRGLDSYDYVFGAEGLGAEQRRAFAALEHVATARPHFLVLHRDMIEEPRVAALRAQGLPVVAWTVRSPEEAAAAAPFCDNIIFEGFRP
jgi:glycerophosphoryl diester phosphodiesterase